MNSGLLFVSLCYIALGVYMILKARNSDASESFESTARGGFFRLYPIEIRKCDHPILFNVTVTGFYIMGAIIVIRGLFVFGQGIGLIVSK